MIIENNISKRKITIIKRYNGKNDSVIILKLICLSSNESLKRMLMR